MPAPVKPQAKPSTAPGSTAAKKPAPAAVRPQAPRSTPSAARSTVTKPNSTAQALQKASQPQAKAAPAAAEEAGAGNWISRMVQGQVQKVGDYAGGYINGIGGSVNKVGEGIGNKYVTIGVTRRMNVH